MKDLETKKKQLIKRMRLEANKAMSNVIANTFDQVERNRAFLEIQAVLANKIKEVESL